MTCSEFSTRGGTRDCVNVTLDGARHLVAALTALIDEVDKWASK